MLCGWYQTDLTKQCLCILTQPARARVTASVWPTNLHTRHKQGSGIPVADGRIPFRLATALSCKVSPTMQVVTRMFGAPQRPNPKPCTFYEDAYDGVKPNTRPKVFQRSNRNRGYHSIPSSKHPHFNQAKYAKKVSCKTGDG